VAPSKKKTKGSARREPAPSRRAGARETSARAEDTDEDDEVEGEGELAGAEDADADVEDGAFGNEADADTDTDADVEAELVVDTDADEGSDADDDGPQRGEAGLMRLGAGARGADRGLARFDPMQAYMREVQQHPLLTPDEEKALAVRYSETGDLEAAARLVTANLRLVVKIAYEYRRAYRNMMDLVQEGNMGLMQAVKKYDPYRGVKLSSYAAWWIRAYMLRYILANWRMVKLGTTQAQRKLFFNLSKEKARLSAMGIEPTNAEIARRLDVAESEVEEMDKRMSRGDASLDLPVSENDGRQIARVELLPSVDTTPDLATESAELGGLLRQHLSEFRATLSDKDLIIFDQRLVADEPRTLQDLGEEFGVSRERVRQLEARITGRLRAFLSQHLGDAVEIAG
jgi:RNA polymerase sigma-32 factor